MSQIDMTEVLPKPVGKSRADGKSPFTSRSNNRRCQLRGLNPLKATNCRSNICPGVISPALLPSPLVVACSRRPPQLSINIYHRVYRAVLQICECNLIDPLPLRPLGRPA